VEERFEKLNEIWQQIETAQSVAIFRHVNPDPDAYGAQFALAHAIADYFPRKKVMCFGERVERLSYLYESGVLFYETLPETIGDALVVVLDTANVPRIDMLPLQELARIDIKIDHHPNIDAYAPLAVVDTDVPACCALLLDYFLYLERKSENFVISNVVYEKLYAGIVGDTGNFRYGTGLNQRFFTNVGAIFEHIDTKSLLAKFFAKTLAEVQFSGAFAQWIVQEDAFAYVDFTSDVVHEAGVSLDYATSRVHQMQDLIGVQVWASFCEDKAAGLIRCSLRSHRLNVGAIAETFGGGGHPNAAGVRLKTWDEVQKLKAALKQLSAQTQ